MFRKGENLKINYRCFMNRFVALFDHDCDATDLQCALSNLKEFLIANIDFRDLELMTKSPFLEAQSVFDILAATDRICCLKVSAPELVYNSMHCRDSPYSLWSLRLAGGFFPPNHVSFWGLSELVLNEVDHRKVEKLIRDCAATIQSVTWHCSHTKHQDLGTKLWESLSNCILLTHLRISVNCTGVRLNDAHLKTILSNMKNRADHALFYINVNDLCLEPSYGDVVRNEARQILKQVRNPKKKRRTIQFLDKVSDDLTLTVVGTVQIGAPFE